MENWEKIKFTDEVELIHGYQFRNYDFTQSGIKIVKIEQLKENGSIDLSNSSFISSDRANEFNDITIKHGDILMALTGATLGKVARARGITETLLQNYRVGRFEIKNSSRLNKDFLFYILDSPEFKKQMMSKVSQGAQGNIGKADFGKFTILLPTLKEQKSIAQILSTVDEAIQKADEAIEHTERLKRGLMQKLLTEGIGHTEFKETKIGRIPKEWEIIELRDLFDLASGKSRPQEFSETKNELYTIPIYGGNGILGFTNQSNVNSEVLVIGRVGEYCGSVHLAPRDSWITDNALFTANLKMGGSMDFHFLKISMVHMNLNRYNRKSGQPLITQSIINDLLIALPPITEQREIVQMTFSIEQKLQLLKERKYQYAKIKYGLMQDLLTGKKRVVLN